MTSTTAGSSTVTFIRFTLRMLEPGAVTVPMPVRRGEVDAVPDLDHRGVAHIPGTSLAGALRAWTTSQYGDDVARTWFGYLGDKGMGKAAGTVDAVASAVWVLGSQLVTESGNAVVDDADWRIDRWSTAIDRSRAAARTSSLRGLTVLAPGARIEAFLRWDGAQSEERDRLLHLLSGWQPVIGRGTSRGMGRCQVESVLHGTLDLSDPTHLLTWLTCGGSDLVRAVAVHRPSTAHHGWSPLPSAPDGVGSEIALAATVVGPLHLGGGREQARKNADGHEVQVLLRERGRYVVPGAGLKGVLRSRVEFILRSVGLDHRTCVSSSDEGMPCGNCWTCDVFGHGGRRDQAAKSVGRRAGIRFCDGQIEDAATRTRQHVAIDRFTGGAMDGLLYTFEVVESGRFVIRIEVRPEYVEDELLRALLRLAFADLDDGRVGIGRSTTRGYGSIRLDLGEAERAGVLPDIRAAQDCLRQTLEQGAADHAVAEAEEVPR
jgi:CRISPR/Cas system CSM-associated protein Csm3 (group 7 of RAMP superfamily)